MSRRHHGRSRHARGRGDDVARAPAQLEPPPTAPTERRHAVVGFESQESPRTESGDGATVEYRPAEQHGPANNGSGPSSAPVEVIGTNGSPRAGCTAPQLRRFIKSRPYVPMHELRRRFGINGAEDDVTALPIEDANVYVGLPEHECRLLGDLVRGGEVGYELSLDPRTPIVVGVYPMRPVPRT
jgi:hypothetical protein